MVTSPAPGRRLIFSANPGRSGSGFLASLLDGSPDVDAGHERLPTMTGPWLRRIAHLGADESRPQRWVKIDAIRAELDALPDDIAYCDTSHMFVRTFADVVLEAFDHESITIIQLRRDPVATALSYYELGLVCRSSGTWHDWMTSPTAPAARFRLRPDDVRSSFDLIFGSLVELHARTVDLRQTHQDVTWVDADLTRIASEHGARELFERLLLTAPPLLASVTRSPVNTKPVEKAQVGRRVHVRTVSERYREFLDRFGDRPEVSSFAADHESCSSIEVA